jgi:hypothetical protein
MRITAISLKPPERIIVRKCYMLDHVALEFDESGALHDCRFEFGCGYDIYWAVPVAPGRRLRLIHVDSAVYELEDYALEIDQFAFDLEAHTWEGELGTVGPGGGRSLVRVSAEATAQPPGYRCEAEVRDENGRSRVYSLSFSGDK